MIKIRLKLLAERLEKIAATPAEKRTRTFDLGTWVRKGDCGTAACACGEATFMKAFRDRGLRYREGIGVIYKDYMGWDAVKSFFGINQREAAKLFSISGYGELPVGADEVAARIRTFIETGIV